MSVSPYRWDRTLSLPRNRIPKQTKSVRTLASHTDSNVWTQNDTLRKQKVSVKPVSGLGGITRTVNGFVTRRKHIVLLGLDGSGKTTILMRLKYSCQISTVPTIGFNHEKVWGGGFRWSAWDVGGGEKLRPLWVMYARATDGLVFVIDASARNDVMEEARVELSKVVKALRSSANSLNVPSPPVLVLANFQDRSYARGPEEIAVALGLSEQWASNVIWAVAPVCGLTGEGLDSAMHTLRALMDGTRRERRTEKGSQAKGHPRWRYG